MGDGGVTDWCVCVCVCVCVVRMHAHVRMCVCMHAHVCVCVCLCVCVCRCIVIVCWVVFLWSTTILKVLFQCLLKCMFKWFLLLS